MIRIDFPGYSGARSLEPITWERWFEKFDESNLALILQDETAGGERSNFNKLISRESVDAEGKVDKSRSRRARGRGGAAAGRRVGAAKGASASSKRASPSSKKASPPKVHAARTRDSRGATKRASSTRTTRRATTGKRRAGSASHST